MVNLRIGGGKIPEVGWKLRSHELGSVRRVREAVLLSRGSTGGIDRTGRYNVERGSGRPGALEYRGIRCSS